MWVEVVRPRWCSAPCIRFERDTAIQIGALQRHVSQGRYSSGKIPALTGREYAVKQTEGLHVHLTKLTVTAAAAADARCCRQARGKLLPLVCAYVPAADAAKSLPTSRKHCATPCTLQVTCLGSVCTVSDSFTTCTATTLSALLLLQAQLHAPFCC